ncbi:MAG: DinB family protein [Armatimonadota bacterium]
MNFYDALERMTREAVEMLFRYARAVPEEKLHWRPAEHARSVIEILQENAILPYTLQLALHERPQTPDASLWERATQLAGDLSTLDACEQACRKGTEALLQAIRQLPPEALEQTVMMPWGKPMSLFELVYDHYWNLTYHLGQIAYIQLLYGDTAFH